MSYLIKDTTKEERINMVKKSLGIVASDNALPTDDTLKLMNKYINGKMELDEIRNIVINKYKKEE